MLWSSSKRHRLLPPLSNSRPSVVAPAAPNANINRRYGNPLPPLSLLSPSAVALVIMVAALVVLSADASAATEARKSSVWSLLFGRQQQQHEAPSQIRPFPNNFIGVPPPSRPLHLRQLGHKAAKPDLPSYKSVDEDVEEFEYEDFPEMPEFLRRASIQQQQQHDGRSYKPLGRKRILGMDIPDYIASSGAGKGTIQSMSNRMKSMGRKKRILGMDIPDYIASSGSGKGTIKRMSDRMKAMGRKKRILGMDIPDYIASSGAGKGTIKSMSDRMKSVGRK